MRDEENPPKELVAHVLKLDKYQADQEQLINEWKDSQFLKRLWAHDYTLWAPTEVPEIANRLGWLAIPERMQYQLDDIKEFARSVKDDGIKHVVLLGMGGSSLAPEMFQAIFENASGYPELIVLDTSHPDQIHAVEQQVNLDTTIFLVASKSGTTLETISLFLHFWYRVSHITNSPGMHFISITDPGSPLEQLAQERNFRRNFAAPPDLGGRYSALTVFGIVPAALIGIDIDRLVEYAQIAQERSAVGAPIEANPGAEIGAALGALYKRKRDKLSLITSPSIKWFPNWLEQLVAESTGKDGKGIIPITNEPISDPQVYSSDRCFAFILLEGEDNAEFDAFRDELEVLGHPTVLIKLANKEALGMEIYFWELSIAAAGSALKIHPFDQPDVELSKQLAKELITAESTQQLQKLEASETILTDNSDKLCDNFNQWLGQARQGDYICIQAYLSAEKPIVDALEVLRLKLLNYTRLATTAGFGPRFLHSTGQLHKGGPNSGLFLQIVEDPEAELPVPEKGVSFKEILRAQALGDYQALKQRGRRVLRLKLTRNQVEDLLSIINLIPDKGCLNLKEDR